MTTPLPTITELDYSIKLMMKELALLSTQISSIKEKTESITTTIGRRRLYMKRLLLYKAEMLLPTKIDAYIDSLIRQYGQKLYSNTPQPPMNDDVTPTWVIADAVIAEENSVDRQNFQTIFRYVYDVEPDVFFVSNNS